VAYWKVSKQDCTRKLLTVASFDPLTVW